MPTTLDSVHDVLATECRNVRNAWPTQHISTVAGAARRAADLITTGHLSHEEVRAALVDAAAQHVADPQCGCSQQVIAQAIDAAITGRVQSL
ncbi:hypothetical protein [Nocardia sp. NPDC051750]|uniref:hypothetical protein n=1 Tax=Nocardia sp. NPDC051750 TaxID=3364325 RepID=UPI003790CF89